MTYKKLLALVLAFAMVLGLAACGDEPEPTTVPTTVPTEAPTTEPTTEPTTAPTTEPLPSPEELYAQAVTVLSAASDYTLSIRSEHTVTVAGAVFTDSSDAAITYSGYGTEAFSAAASETVDSDGYRTTYDEVFLDGTLYTTVDDSSHFKGAVTADEYISRYAPVVMLDAALYGEITAEGDVLTFSAPTAGESWIVPEHGTLLDATGTATLGGDGGISGYTYSVTYAIGGAEIHYGFEMDIQTAPAAAPAAIDESIEYIELEYVDAPRLMEQAAGYLWQPAGVHSVSTSLAESIVTYAGGAVRNQSTAVNTWSDGDDYMGNVDISIYLMHSEGSDSYEQEERFVNNMYTVSVDGGAPRKQTGVTADAFQAYCVETFANAIPVVSYLSGCTATDLGSIYFLELTYTEELAESMKGAICATFWNDEAFLDDLTDEYRTQEMTGYLSIDKNTGLPLAVGYYYEGYHTLSGQELMLSLQRDQSFDLVSTGTYETIKEVGPVPAEPEEKATPLFYHVTGENGQEMWLLGTIHIGDGRTSYLPQEIYDAFDAADALAVEFNSDAFYDEVEENEELSDQVSANYFYDDGSQTSDHVEDEELFGYAEMYLKATGNYHMNAPYMKVNAWANSIDNFFLRQAYDLSSTQGVDNQLIWRANDQGKEILDVESGLFQVGMLMGFSDGLQEQLLYEAVYADPYEYVEGTRELFEMWCAGDEAALIAYLTEEPDYSDLTEEEISLIEEYNNAMGTDRNDDMHDVAVGYLESGDVVFYAVGLAHLLAEDGLVNTLRDAGYTVELVEYE